MEPLMSRTDVRLWWLPHWCLFMVLLLVLLHQPPCSDRLGRCNVAFTALDIPKCDAPVASAREAATKTDELDSKTKTYRREVHPQ